MHVSGRTRWCNRLIDTSAKDSAALISCSRVGERGRLHCQRGRNGDPTEKLMEQKRMKKKKKCIYIYIYIYVRESTYVEGRTKTYVWATSTTSTEAVNGCTHSPHSPWKHSLSDVRSLQFERQHWSFVVDTAVQPSVPPASPSQHKTFFISHTIQHVQKCKRKAKKKKKNSGSIFFLYLFLPESVKKIQPCLFKQAKGAKSQNKMW